MTFRRVALSSVMLASSLASSLACNPDPEPSEGWQEVFEGLDSALLSIWGRGPDDVWVVGSDVGAGPELLHFDGAAWTRMSTGQSANLWWVSGIDDEIWMAGEQGLIVRHDRSAGSFEAATTPEPVTLFGILPLASDDVWAVGGDLEAGRGVVWHYDGTAWTEDAETTPLLTEGVLYKIWGERSDRLFAVGAGGTNLIRTADGWAAAPVPVDRNLFTVHGSGEHVVAVGGFIDGLLVEWDGSAWVDATPAGAPQLNGVWVEADGSAMAVGVEGSIWRRSVDGAWAADDSIDKLFYDFHSAYVDPSGGMWAVGGFVIAAPFDRGMLYHHGDALPTTIE
ncbi:hypothetical protein ACNOYE_33940 [Nannocystaceae bacterium ST9]